MELFAMKDLSGARALADPAQQGWKGTSQEWLSRRMAVFGLQVRAREDGGAHTRIARGRRPHRLLRLRGRWNRKGGRRCLPGPRRDGATAR